MNHARRNVEDIILSVLLIAVGAIRIGIAVSANEVWQVEPSIALGLVAIGVYIFVRAKMASSSQPTD